MAALLSPHICLGKLWSAFVTARVTLSENKVETLIGYQAEFEIQNLIRIPFLSDNIIL